MVEWPAARRRQGGGTISDTRFWPETLRFLWMALSLSGHGAALNFLKAANTGDAVCVEIHRIGEGRELWTGHGRQSEPAPVSSRTVPPA